MRKINSRPVILRKLQNSLKMQVVIVLLAFIGLLIFLIGSLPKEGFRAEPAISNGTGINNLALNEAVLYGNPPQPQNFAELSSAAQFTPEGSVFDQRLQSGEYLTRLREQNALDILNRAPNPWTLGDPMIFPMTAGPLGSPQYNSGRLVVYDAKHRGPVLGEPMNVPVPVGALAEYNERYNRQNISSRDPASRTAFGPRTQPLPRSPGRSVEPYSSLPKALPSSDFFRPYGPNTPPDFPSFVGSSSIYAPIPEVITPFEKIGLLEKVGGFDDDHHSPKKSPTLMNLYRRPIAPMQDLWEYEVQDSDGFVLRLPQRTYLENGEFVEDIPGKPGKWKIINYSENKYVWV